MRGNSHVQFLMGNAAVTPQTYITKTWKRYTIMEHPLAQFLYCPECGSSHFEINNEKSKKCADCGFVYYFNPSAATVALILTYPADSSI